MKKKLITITVTLLILATLSSLLVFLPACNEGTEQVQQDEQSEQQQEKTTIHEVEPISIGILADLQLIPEEHLLDIDSALYINFLDHSGNFKMPELTEAIYKTSVDELIAADVDVAFIIGDLTDNGALRGLEIVADGCAKLEAAGIPTFVTNGLCDVNAYRKSKTQVYTTINPGIYDYDYAPVATKQQYLDLFDEYGYGEALSRDANSLSYSADIPGTNYRLIVVDNASYFGSNSTTNLEKAESEKMPAGQMEWIQNALLDAKAMAKEPIVITNIPLNGKPVSYFNDFVADTHLTMQEGAELEALFAGNGVKYVFSGHYHINAELDVATEQGTLTEIYTSNTCTYPCTIRYFNINSDYSYNTERALIEKLDTEYLTNTNIPQDEKVAASTGFVAYSKLRVNRSLEQSLHANMYRKKGYKDMLIFFFEGLAMYPSDDPTTNAILEQINTDVLQWMLDYNNMPIYGMDGTTETVQSICASYGVTVPNSRYAGHTVKEFIFNLVYRIFDSTFMVEEADIDSTIFSCIFKAGAYKMACLELFDTIHQIITAVVDCDMFKVVENFMKTDVLDLRVDNFFLATISLFFPYIKQKFGIDLSSVTSVDGLLDVFDIVMPVLSAGIPDLNLFCNEEGKLEKEGVYSLRDLSITGKPFVEYLMFSVIVRSTLIL